MMETEVGWAFVTGFAIAALISFIINESGTVDTKSVIKESQFIFRNATYKCKKTNELVND